ncbi:MAG TPA: type II secretion system protein N [Ramlibacter sp.]|uniref:type II secretion system protein N n=1 Tax=Ramlibacter sp. TaxID=1917967 RepID=UPI002D46AA44|nr:type II secretion system protein N [Ramlibacter sp.]HZY19702.1 type II secretion system protein N [Ramlibacter sp.]
MPRATIAVRSTAPWRWAVAGAVLGLLLAFVFFVPAQWLADRVATATAGQLLLQDARGTIWNGSAQPVLTGGSGSSDAAALPSRLEWRLRPALAGATIMLSSACCMPQPVAVQVRLGWGSTTVRVADSQTLWPATLLAGLGTPWNTLQPEGDLAVRTQGLSLEWAAGRLSVQGAAELTAQRMASRLSTLRPMGSYRVVLSGGTVPSVRLSTLEGALQLSGSGQWVGSHLRFTGEATSAPDREAALANLLNIIGRRNGARSIITIG